jgi:hypothetical protein
MRPGARQRQGGRGATAKSPRLTVQSRARVHWSDDPTFDAQFDRITEGLRKAGLPEGEKSTN